MNHQEFLAWLEDLGAQRAQEAPPLTDEQVEAAARLMTPDTTSQPTKDKR